MCVFLKVQALKLYVLCVRLSLHVLVRAVNTKVSAIVNSYFRVSLRRASHEALRGVCSSHLLASEAPDEAGAAFMAQVAPVITGPSCSCALPCDLKLPVEPRCVPPARAMMAATADQESH